MRMRMMAAAVRRVTTDCVLASVNIHSCRNTILMRYKLGAEVDAAVMTSRGEVSASFLCAGSHQLAISELQNSPLTSAMKGK